MDIDSPAISSSLPDLSSSCSNNNNSGAHSTSSSVSGNKRKLDDMNTNTTTTSHESSSATLSSPSSSSSDDPSSKKARLSITPMSFEERSQLDATLAAQKASNPSHAGERVCIRSEIEVDDLGIPFVHLTIFTPTARSRALEKEKRYQDHSAKMKLKKQDQKRKAKEKKSAQKEERDAYEAELKQQGKSDSEIAALLRARNQRIRGSPSSEGGAHGDNDNDNGMAMTAAQKHTRSSRQVKEIKAAMLSDMRAHLLPKIVIDCSFDHLMRLEEVCSLVKQIKYMYGYNLRAKRAVHLILTSLLAPSPTTAAPPSLPSPSSAPPSSSHSSSGFVDHFDVLRDADVPTQDTNTTTKAFETVTQIVKELQLADPKHHAPSSASSIPSGNLNEVAMYTRSGLARMDGFEALVFDRTSHHFNAVFSHDRIVYLTAESSTVLHELDPKAVYVIGGIVDHNRMKGLCDGVANAMQIKTARLPIQEYLHVDKRTVITVNQVFEIMLKKFEEPNAAWPEVFQAVLPARSNWKVKTSAASSSSTTAANSSAAGATSATADADDEELEDENEQKLNSLEEVDEAEDEGDPMQE